MFRLKKIINYDEIIKLELDTENEFSAKIISIEQTLENAGYNVEHGYVYVNRNKSWYKYKGKTFACEIYIFPSSLTKSEAKKHFKLKVFCVFFYKRIRLNKNEYKVFSIKDWFYKLYVSFIFKLLAALDIEKIAKDNVFDFFLRIFCPNKSGELAYLYRGKDCEWVKLVLYIVVGLIAAIAAGYKEAVRRFG